MGSNQVQTGQHECPLGYNCEAMGLENNNCINHKICLYNYCRISYSEQSIGQNQTEFYLIDELQKLLFWTLGVLIVLLLKNSINGMYSFIININFYLSKETLIMSVHFMKILFTVTFTKTIISTLVKLSKY